MRIPLSVAVLAVLTSPGALADTPSYLAELQQAATQAHLADDPGWHRLLHYRPRRVLGGVESVIDSDNFFLAEDGKTDPAAELGATLARFFDTDLLRGEPPQCRFKARYEWLQERLAFDASRLAPQDCTLYRQWEGAAPPGQAHLIFASSDLGSPATMYGHTLLRIDAAGSSQPLLSRAVSYAATVAPDVGSLSYMARGLGGGFIGEFSVMPYHEKVREYARIDERDLWEYPLALTPDEIRRMLWHLWELRGVGADYYFLSENCSYMLLALIDTARPGLNLAAEFDDPAPYTIPLDTVRVLREHGLLGEPVYRISPTRRLRQHLAELDPDLRQWILDYAAGSARLDDPRLQQRDDRDRARALETANQYLATTRNPGTMAEALALGRPLLLARSQIAGSAGFDDPPAPVPTPDRGHESSRLDFGARRGAGRTAAVLRARGAYHDRLDPPGGYLPAGELEFFTAELRGDKDAVQLADLTLVNIQAVAPWSPGFHPWSWQAAFGAHRYGLDALAAHPQGRLGGYVNAGGGLSFAPAPATIVYGFAMALSDANPDLEDGYGIAGGARLGFAVQPAAGWNQQLEFDALDRIAGGAEPRRELHFGSNIPLGPRDGLRLSLTHLTLDGVDAQSVELKWLRYF